MSGQEERVSGMKVGFRGSDNWDILGGGGLEFGLIFVLE